MDGVDRVVVTGAAGFIGSHTAEALVRLGCDVVGVDNFDPYYPRAMKDANVESIHRVAADASGSFEFVEADFCDASAVARALDGSSAVVHLGAKAGVRPSIEDPPGYARANVLGTSVVLDAAHKAGCDRVIVASSSSVYGNASEVPFSEAAETRSPISPYAATKRSCELLGSTHHHLTGQPVSMLRFFTVFGPRQRPDLAIRLFLDRVSKGEPITMFGDGSTSRDYTYVDDIVAGVLAAIEKTPEHGYRIWNLGGDHPATLTELIETIGEVVGREPVIERAPMQPGDVNRTWADLTRSRAELGYSPKTSLREGIEKQWAWMLEHQGG